MALCQIMWFCDQQKLNKWCGLNLHHFFYVNKAQHNNYIVPKMVKDIRTTLCYIPLIDLNSSKQKAFGKYFVIVIVIRINEPVHGILTKS